MSRVAQPGELNKAFLYDWQAVQDAEDAECCYCLTDKHIETLLTMTPYLGWLKRWFHDDADALPTQDYIDAFQADLEVRLMSGSCGCTTPRMTRFNPDGVFQYSDDGGLTWIDAPELAPNVNGSYFPPLPGDDGTTKKCNAARAAADFIKAQTDALIANDTVWGTITEIVAAIGALFLEILIVDPPAIIILGPVIVIVGTILFFIGLAAFTAAMTSDVYDRLFCNFYCNIRDDGSFSSAGIGRVQDKLADDETGIAYSYLHSLINALGTTGLTNAARSNPDAVGDCSACDCPVPCGDAALDVVVGTITDHDPDTGTWTIESGTGGAGALNNIAFNVSADETACCCVNAADVVPTGNTELWYDCDNTSHFGGPAGHCIRAYSIYNDNPGSTFTLSLTLAPCGNPGVSDCV